MNRLCVCRDWVALWFTSVTPTGRTAALAIRRALRMEGYEPWSEAESELFSLAGGTLLIARPGGKITARGDSTG